LGDGQWVTEALFAPDPEGRSVRDGWLLSLVYDENAHQSYLAVLDATDLGRGALARVWYPQQVHWTFHGIWMPGVVARA
jgi:carotenoid cleavage dioxygenase-like enzyme